QAPGGALSFPTRRSSDLLHLDDVRVPDEQRLGEVNEGFVQIMRNFQWERVVMALAAVAGAEQTLEGGVQYANERQAFGRPVATLDRKSTRLNSSHLGISY